MTQSDIVALPIKNGRNPGANASSDASMQSIIATQDDLAIRHEAPTDWPVIAQINRDAFGGDFEVNLVQDLRQDGLVFGAYVVIANQQIVGHAVFSHLPVKLDGAAVPSLALGPISVRSDYRGQSVGKLLINTGLDAARAAGIKAMFVLGDPAYYGRFGFNSHLASHLNAPFEEDSFMALELVDGALDGQRGVVTYPDAWGLNNPGVISL